MRIIMSCVAIMAFVVANAGAQDGAATAKNAITDATIINLCGGRLAKMFAQCGTPENLQVKRGGTPDEDDVLFVYESVGFRVRDKVVRTCFFWSNWKGPIRGIKIGDSREDVVKVLGKAPTTDKDKDGAITAYGYDLKDLDADFFTNFDKDGKVWRVEVSLK
jgi:hypothetical protein